MSLVRSPAPDERAFVRNQSGHSVSIGLLVLKRSHGVFVDLHWGTFEAFRYDVNVVGLLNNGRIAIEYIKQAASK